ncbi:SMODS domain-containing nucleotidyltransferase [Bacillus paranthracis]|uniref:SMODS domain-containing nucleotidyltransferase n=1 Tax=Bacillus paranthracis TaxID=2026186 RepID=UPI001E37E127|nr:nucleotidyltransferase [Bacillus paranthracis]MCD1177546.1 nucleotidyltransferase [Bacillus paranthracis]HDR4568430.1 nucleotidyltransferase [Bacillus paranthracis]
MGVAENFKAFTNNLRTTNHAIVSERCKRVTKRINLDFRGLDSSTSNSRYVGSYGRGTDIKGFSDVDILMVLPYDMYAKYNSYIGNGQSALLQAVRNSIKLTYPNTEIGGDGQVVVVNFSDGVKFEIVPAFLNEGGKSYTYADSNNGGSWKVCKPILEIEAINEQNKMYNKKVKHLVRMMKAWKNKNNVSISGLLIETLVMNFMKDWEHNDKSYIYYDWMARDFFKYLSECNPEQGYWLAWGSKQYVWRRGNFEYKAKQAYKTTLEAIEYDKKDYTYSAKEKWQEVFGKSYVG